MAVNEMVNTYHKLGKDREQRVRDAIALKQPDRVPIIPFFQFFPAFYSGVTPEEVMCDYEKAYAAYKKTIIDFEPDMYIRPAVFRSGPVLEALGCKNLQWPGHGVISSRPYEYIEGQHIPPEGYDEYIENPSDWLMKKYRAHIFGAMEPFSALPNIFDQFYYYGAPSAGVATTVTPEAQETFQRLSKASRESLKWTSGLQSFVKEMDELGFKPFSFVSTLAPFDLVADFLRGTREVVTDMSRSPDKLLEAVEKSTQLLVSMAMKRAAATEIPIVLIPIHKGAEEFMSREQFKTFYWPSLKKLIMGIIEASLIPYVYTEGKYTSRLEVIREVPRGKVLYHFEYVDMAMAKEILGDVACISGNVPNSMLVTGTPQQVKDYCKELIDVAGKGGGFIMDASACIDEAKPENVKAMMDFTREYGMYG
jgi:hypothetical protein